MSNPWFRVYAEFSHDPKVQMMTEAMQRRYIMVMCLRCSNTLVTLHETEVAFHLRISNEELAETKALFVEKGFIDESWNLLNWDKRQFVSDSSYERVKRHREKRVEKGLPAQNFIPQSVRKRVLDRDGHRCVYCGTTHDLTMDHDIPQSRGGDDKESNLLTACRACNAAKRDLTFAEYVERNGIVTLLKRNDNGLYTETDTKTDTDKKKKTIQPPSGVSEKVWTDFVQHRKDRRSRITDTAIDGIRREADKAGWTLEDALSECCSRGWTGFKAEWVSSSAQKSPVDEPKWRSEQRERTARAVPSIAEKKLSDVIEMEAANVVAIALGR